MGNCALKPKVLSEAGAPAPEELKDSLLEDQKMDAAKSLSNLFLQDKAEKNTKAEEQLTQVTEDLKTAMIEEKSPTEEATHPTSETKVPADDQKAKNEEVVSGEKVIDDVTMKETETEAKAEGMGRESSTTKVT